MLPRDENSLLRSKCAELEETYTNLRARCFAMESMSSTRRDLDLPTYMYNNPTGCQPQRARTATSATRNRNTSTGDRRVAKENQDLITSLYRRNEEIMRDYSILRNKHQNVLSNNGKLKKEVQSLRLRASANYRPRTSIFPTSSSFARTGATLRIARDASHHHCAKRRQTPYAYDDDVDGAKEIDSLSEALASTNTDKFMEAERRHLPSDPPIFATQDPTGVAFPVISCPPSDHHFQSHESLVKDLADATSKLHSLKEKYGKLESTCNECLDTLEQTKHELKVTRKAKELLEEEVSELRSQNASLEEKVTQLCCDAPITSIRLPSADAEPTAVSSVADPCPTTTASPTDESKEGKDRDSDGSDSACRAEIIHKKAASVAEEAASAEKGGEEEETQDRGQESSESEAPEITDTTSLAARAPEDATIDTNKGTPIDPAPSSKVVENVDAESQSSYQDETFDEYASDTFED